MSPSHTPPLAPDLPTRINKTCVYPESFATKGLIKDELEGLVTNKKKCTSFYLDTTSHESNSLYTQGGNHHQGLARTHKLSDGSIYFFLSHSEVDEGSHGSVMQFRYAGPVDGSHVLQTSPFTVAPMTGNRLVLADRHPADLVFLADVNNTDAGYLFVTEQFDKHRVGVYYWEPTADLKPLGNIEIPDPYNRVHYIFLDKIDDYYYLGIIGSTQEQEDAEDSNAIEKGWLYRAKYNELFPVCEKGKLNYTAFKWYAPGVFDYKLPGYFPSQIKLIRDASGKWYLLGFRSKPDDDPKGDDYIDYREIHFEPFKLGEILGSVHIYLNPGDTGFANTGTHYVESSGRLLISSSYRWSEIDLHLLQAGYVSRVDECPSR